MASAALVIGYGNPLRADDGLGRVVAQQLAAGRPPGHVRIIAAHQLTPELAEPIGQSDLVIFVDAHDGDRPGRIDCRVVAPAGSDSLPFSHDVDPPALLELARLLYGAGPIAVVISVDGQDFGYGTSLSAEVQAAVPLVVERVHAVLAGGVATPDRASAPLEPPVDRRVLSCTS